MLWSRALGLTLVFDLSMTVSATPTSSTVTPAADADAASPADERTLVRAVLAMGVGGFAIGTGEFVIMVGGNSRDVDSETVNWER